MEEWMSQPEEVRKADEKKMKGEWDAWMSANKDKLVGMTAGAGKTKRVSAKGVEDTKNDTMMFSIIEASSHEEAAKLFENHPHFQIPGAAIEVMPANVLPGMEGMQ
jgi:hypothetical protein